MCTQRTGMSTLASPASRPTSTSARTSRMVSMASCVQHPARCLLEDRPQHALDLLELLGTGDERRRELDHGIAAVVGAADQPAAVHLGRQVAADQRLALLAREVVLGVA